MEYLSNMATYDIVIVSKYWVSKKILSSVEGTKVIVKVNTENRKVTL